MRHGVLFYEAMGLIRKYLDFCYGVFIYEATREEVYLCDYADLHELERALGRWFDDYNHWRPHDSLDEQRPWEVYRPGQMKKEAA